MTSGRDHGGGLDGAIALYGGSKHDWLDLSTGINPVPYPIPDISNDAWERLPDQNAIDHLLNAARSFWNVPDGAEIIAAPGASALIARMPYLTGNLGTFIPGPTYNEHAAAFRAVNPKFDTDDPDAPVHIYVHPNNPDGKLWPTTAVGGRDFTIVDESFCDVSPQASHIAQSENAGVIVLKSFGKFWGLAGLRLGFAIAEKGTLKTSCAVMDDLLGPWAVSGPALEIGARALADTDWADATRARLSQDAKRLDTLMAPHSSLEGGTDLFRLYRVDDAQAWQDRLAQHHIWSRIFPYSRNWLRLGLPAPDRWDQLESAL
ncbi:MAG: pyridoxal phosphate-dependent class II aminotransferase [Marinosulfonomonas sp.]|nr:pyridoxal phosphate-dependent class II aminotransferase [Marinosulfonomonas sp.]